MTAAAAIAPALAYHTAVRIPDTRGFNVRARLIAKQLRALKPIRADLDACRDELAAAYDAIADRGPTREEMNTLLHELFAWANVEVGGKQVCRISLF